jgi:hypothetical protein
MASQFHHNGAGGSSTAVLEMESIPMTPLNLNNKGSGENFSITTPPDSLNVTRRASTDEESVPGPGAGAVAEVKERCELLCLVFSCPRCYSERGEMIADGHNSL